MHWLIILAGFVFSVTIWLCIMWAIDERNKYTNFRRALFQANNELYEERGLLGYELEDIVERADQIIEDDEDNNNPNIDKDF